ncbi:MAG: permease-like cell division protein FtsX [Defluviitaleaceae bacterium]|nr:permease-like cell division protein FtsX [Defluviitaleaceae bacterium]
MTTMPKDSKTNTARITKASSAKKVQSPKLRNIKYYLSQTLKSLWRNKLMSLTSVITVAACMIMVIGSFAATSNVSLFLDYLENQVGITVHIHDDLNDYEVARLYSQIMATDNVASVRLVSPDEALVTLAYVLGDERGIMAEALEGRDNPLRRTFVTELDNVRQQRLTIEAFERLSGIAFIDASAEAAEMLISANNFLAIFGFVVVAVLGILSVVIITNTIKLTVNSRRNEIVIMKYVGATDSFIRWPFILEGVMIGIIGGLIPLTIAWFGYESLIESMTTSGSGILYFMVREFPFRSAMEIFPILLPVIIIMGGGIGVLGSISSMRKHLNV